MDELQKRAEESPTAAATAAALVKQLQEAAKNAAEDDDIRNSSPQMRGHLSGQLNCKTLKIDFIWTL